MNRKDRHQQDIALVQVLAKVTDMLEYACWDYADDATEAKNLIKEADAILDKLRLKED